MILLKTFSFIIFYFLINYHLEQDYDRPNIIFYLADDQDQIDYGVYGNNLVKTPAVDKLAKEGMLFQMHTQLKQFAHLQDRCCTLDCTQ